MVKNFCTIDFFVVCERVLPYVTEMKIDNDNQHRITNFYNIKKGNKTTNADHIPMWITVDLKVAPEKPEKIEIINFKDTEAQKQFKTKTNLTKDFTECTESGENITDKSEIWKHLLNKHCSQSFKKIRIRKQILKPSKENQLISERQKLAKTKKDENCQEIKDLDLKINEIIAEEEREKCIKFKQFENQKKTVPVPVQE